MARILITADIHLSANPTEDYRFRVFKSLQSKAQAYEANAIVIAGDLTHNKDSHPSRLVGRVVDELVALSAITPVYVVMGNHDCHDPAQPFFKFLNHIEGIRFVSEAEQVVIAGTTVNLLPWSPNNHRGIQLSKAPWTKAPLTIMHQHIAGASSPYGVEIQGGMSTHKLRGLKSRSRIIAGDIHSIQKVGPVEYVGSPHPVSFGENHKPRFILWSPDEELSLPVPSIRKMTVDISSPLELRELGLEAGDFVKIRFHRDMAQRATIETDLNAINRICERLAVRLVSCDVKVRAPELERAVTEDKTSPATFDAFCEEREIDDACVERGREIIESVGG